METSQYQVYNEGGVVKSILMVEDDPVLGNLLLKTFQEETTYQGSRNLREETNQGADSLSLPTRSRLPNRFGLPPGKSGRHLSKKKGLISKRS